METTAKMPESNFMDQQFDAFDTISLPNVFLAKTADELEKIFRLPAAE